MAHRFFTAFDSDRPSLITAYAPTCSFSYSIDTTAPFRSRAKKIGAPGDKKFPHQHKLDWKPYYDGSRNLTRVLGAGRSIPSPALLNDTEPLADEQHGESLPCI